MPIRSWGRKGHREGWQFILPKIQENKQIISEEIWKPEDAYLFHLQWCQAYCYIPPKVKFERIRGRNTGCCVTNKIMKFWVVRYVRTQIMCKGQIISSITTLLNMVYTTKLFAKSTLEISLHFLTSLHVKLNHVHVISYGKSKQCRKKEHKRYPYKFISFIEVKSNFPLEAEVQEE